MPYSKISRGLFEPVAGMTGGRAYREELCRALGTRFDVEVLEVTGERGLVPSVRLRRMAEIARVNKGKDIEDLDQEEDVSEKNG